MTKRQIKKAKECSLEEKTRVSKPEYFVNTTLAFILTMENILGVEPPASLGKQGNVGKLSGNSRQMINNKVSKVNPSLNTPLPEISIEIRPEIIYVENI